MARKTQRRRRRRQNGVGREIAATRNRERRAMTSGGVNAVGNAIGKRWPNKRLLSPASSLYNQNGKFQPLRPQHNTPITMKGGTAHYRSPPREPHQYGQRNGRGGKQGKVFTGHNGARPPSVPGENEPPDPQKASAFAGPVASKISIYEAGNRLKLRCMSHTGGRLQNLLDEFIKQLELFGPRDAERDMDWELCSTLRYPTS